MTAATHLNIWNTYSSAWNAPEDQRRGILEASLTADAVYTDPILSTTGIDALLGYMGGFQAQFPGCGFVVRRFHFHGNRSIAVWDMCDADGNVVSDGISYGEYRDGKILTMTGFFDVP